MSPAAGLPDAVTSTLMSTEAFQSGIYRRIVYYYRQEVGPTMQRDELKTLIVVASIIALPLGFASRAVLPANYQGKPFEDSVYKGGAQVIPG